MPVVPASPEVRGAERPSDANESGAAAIPGSACCATRVPCGSESQAAPVVQYESRAEGCSGEGLYHSIEAPAQPARAVDAAARRARSSVFEMRYQLKAFPDRMRRRG
jgi:hypothetical protein